MATAPQNWLDSSEDTFSTKMRRLLININYTLMSNDFQWALGCRFLISTNTHNSTHITTEYSSAQRMLFGWPCSWIASFQQPNKVALQTERYVFRSHAH